MKAENLISSDQVSRIFTVYSPDTFRLLAMLGKVPVANWHNHEPVFKRDPATVRAILQLTRAESKPRATTEGATDK